jgi:hypothetical protein
MLTEFRALGGVAENVVLRAGPRGRGIFPIRPGEPMRLHAPLSLLVPIADLVFEGDDLRIREDSALGEHERAFFERYQRAFAWGAGARADCETYLERLEAVPTALRNAVLSELRIGAFFKGSELAPTRAASRYVGTRMITRQGVRVLMPVVDLINHAPDGVQVDMRDGATVSGVFDDEARFRYALADPLAMFVGWGFATPEHAAFSLPVRLEGAKRALVINRSLPTATAHNRLQPPTVTREEGAIILSHALLGHQTLPKLAKTQFYAAMKEADVDDPEAVFDTVAHHNRLRLLNVLELLEDRPGEWVAELRRAVRFQLRSLSYGLGARTDGFDAVDATPQEPEAVAGTS